jgi:succinyl-diaminopimelate desuccinylase
MRDLPQAEVTTFLQTLVSVPSCDPPGDEAEVARIVHEQMLALGINSEMDEFQPGRINVLGRVKGTGVKQAMVFSAHLDTVPVGTQSWDFPPFAGDVVSGQLRGRGSSDMKSAVAAFIFAAAEIAARDEPLAGDIILAFTAGESSNCLGAKRFVEQGLQDEIGAFLCGEPSTLDIITVEKAILWLDVEAVGEIGHVSGAAGVNAIELMAESLLKLRQFEFNLPPHPLLSPPTLNVGRITGGSAVNVTPDHCHAEVDVRFSPGVDHLEIVDRIQGVLPDGVTVTVSDFKPAVEEPTDSAFVQVCSDACAVETGSAPEIKGVSYYSDGAILMDGVDAPFAILGPGYLGMSGQPNETISVENLEKSVAIYRRIAETWLTT